MSLLVTSDLHAHAWSRFATTTADGLNSRFQDLLNVLDQIERIAEECGADALAILGDLTHQRYYMRFSIYTPLMEWLVKMKEKMPVVVLKGNHDEETATTHSLGPLTFAGIDVIDEPVLVRLPGIEDAFFAPYMDGDRLVAALQGRSASHLFAHYALDGKVMTGGEYALTTPLHLSDLDGFDRIVLGHVHAPSIEYDARVIYVGAPLHFDFGDTGDRFCWFFPDDGKPLAFKLGAPKFVTTTYPRIGTAPLEHSGFLRVLNTPASIFEDVKREARELGWLDCMPIETRMPDEAVQVLSSAIMADEQVVRAWVERQYAALADAEREHIAAFGLDCLREAQR